MYTVSSLGIVRFKMLLLLRQFKEAIWFEKTTTL